MQNLKIISQTGAEKSVTEYFVREKEKWTNKGTDKPCVPVDSLTHSTTRQSNVKILGQVVPEKSLMGKSLQTNTETYKHCYRKGKYYISKVLTDHFSNSLPEKTTKDILMKLSFQEIFLSVATLKSWNLFTNHSCETKEDKCHFEILSIGS